MISRRASAGAGRTAKAALRRFPFLLLAAPFVFVFSIPWEPGDLRAQGVERVGSAEASIFEDNLDVAKRRAVRGAQQNAIERMLGEMIAPAWRELFATEILRGILRRPSRYVSAYRVRRLEASPDRTRYFATLAAQIDRERLVRDLHDLSLPLRSDPKKRVLLLFAAADPLFGLGTPGLGTPGLGGGGQGREALEKLTSRLGLLNLEVARTVPLSTEDAAKFANPFGDAAPRGEWLGRRKVAAGLFLTVDAGQAGAGVPELTAYLYQAGSGAVLGSFSVGGANAGAGKPGQTAPRGPRSLAGLVGPLIEQLQPGGIKPFGPSGGKTAPLKLKVLGLASVEEEELFARDFFRPGSQFENFILARLDAESVTYSGTFTGNRRDLEVDLPGKAFGQFTIAQVFWFNDILELVVRRSAVRRFSEVELFVEELRPPPVAAAIEAYLARNPEYTYGPPQYAEVEDNGWLSRANTLPFNVTIYGFIDSRRDSDFFVAEELKAGEEVFISWHRVGRTNLAPVVRIYDERGLSVRFFNPRFRIRTRYKVPKGQNGFFVEVTDRFGGIKWDTGGYLSFNYLLLVERAGED